jgi:DeoR/GlpR family transcriptional regulator of sugar metabolism
LAAERQERIRMTLDERGAVRVEDLSLELHVSRATVRRDLHELEAGGHARRVHGGAVAAWGRLEEPLFDDKAGLADPEKQAIADEALKLVGPEDCVYLDGGSTVLALAKRLGHMNSLTVVTNSLRVAGTLAGGGPRLILVGGELRRRSQTFVGVLTEPLISRLHLDKAFMGTIGLTAAEGLTTTDPNEAMTKQQVMAHAGKVILLADSSKIGVVSFARGGSIEDVDVLITDSGADAGFVRQAEKAGVRVARVPRTPQAV